MKNTDIDDVSRYFEKRDEYEASLAKMQSLDPTYSLHFLIATIMLTLGGGVFIHSCVVVRRRCVHWFFFAIIALAGLLSTTGTALVYFIAAHDAIGENDMPHKAMCSIYSALNICSLSVILCVAVTIVLKGSRFGNRLNTKFAITMAFVTGIHASLMFGYTLKVAETVSYPVSNYMTFACGDGYFKTMWIVCESKGDRGLLLLVFEFILIYFPYFGTFLVGMYFTDSVKREADDQQNDSSLSDSESTEKQTVRRREPPSCPTCKLLKSTSLWVMAYVGTVVLLIRPLMIGDAIYAGDSYADIFVPLSVLSLFDFICLEYIYCVYFDSRGINTDVDAGPRISSSYEIVDLIDFQDKKVPISVES